MSKQKKKVLIICRTSKEAKERDLFRRILKLEKRLVFLPVIAASRGKGKKHNKRDIEK